ncbi:protein casc4-like isoform x1 protein, partial [Lasius niger]
DYGNVVQQCARLGLYPVLDDRVFVDVYYKLIEPDERCRLIRSYDCSYESPEIIYERDNVDFGLTFVYGDDDKTVCVYGLNDISSLDTSRYETRCIRIQLERSVVAETLKMPSSSLKSLEHELYYFIAHLNTNVPKIRRLLNLSFSRSTRFLPQSVRTWVERYSTRHVSSTCMRFSAASERFGPTTGSRLRPSSSSSLSSRDDDADVLTPRTVLGDLAPCTSKEDILSLRDHTDWTIPEPYLRYYHVYNMHYSERWKTVFPLAYNPLENPVLHL